MTKLLNILIVEDNEDDCLLVLRELRKGGYEPVFKRVDTAEAMLQALQQRPWDVIVSDYLMPKFSGLAALSILHDMGLDLPFIIVSGNIGEDIAVRAMKAGAHDYIIKGNFTRLIPAIERELRDADVRRERIILKGDVPNPANPPPGCAFHRRCPFATEVCAQERPELRPLAGRMVACHHAEKTL